MSNVKTITLAGRSFAVPRLPIHPNRDVYPICARLHNNGLLERSVQAGGLLQATPEEMDDLAEMAFAVANWVDPEVTRDVFDAMPIAPNEYLDAYMTIRLQTGGWVEKSPPTAGIDAGEAKRARGPRKNPRRK